MAELITIARPYAKAVFDLARESGRLAEWSEALQNLAVAVSVEDVKDLLTRPNVSTAQVAEFVGSFGAESLGEVGSNFVRLLAENHRLGVLPDIAGLFEVMKTEAEQAIDVEVASVQPVSEDYQRKLADVLQRKLGREVRLRCVTDETLLGGAVIRAGDMVIDGSVRGGLNKLAASLAG